MKRIITFMAILGLSLSALSAESTMLLNARGGVNIAAKSEFSKGIGGSFIRPLGGLDFWLGGLLGPKMEIGASITYLPVFTETTASKTTSLVALPLMVEARYFLMEGVYGGAGLGIAPETLLVASDKSTVYAAALSARAGYEYNLSSDLVVGGSAQLIYLMQTLNFPGSVSKSNSNANFLFTASFGKRF